MNTNVNKKRARKSAHLTIPWSFLNQETRTRLLGLRDISPDDRTWFFARVPSSALDFFVSGTLAWLFEPLGRPLFLLRSMLPNSVFFRGNPEEPLVSSCPSSSQSVCPASGSPAPGFWLAFGFWPFWQRDERDSQLTAWAAFQNKNNAVLKGYILVPCYERVTQSKTANDIS